MVQDVLPPPEVSGLSLINPWIPNVWFLHAPKTEVLTPKLGLRFGHSGSPQGPSRTLGAIVYTP